MKIKFLCHFDPIKLEKMQLLKFDFKIVQFQALPFVNYTILKYCLTLKALKLKIFFRMLRIKNLLYLKLYNYCIKRSLTLNISTKIFKRY